MTDDISNSSPSFLSMVSDYVIEKYADNLGDLCIVFPNRRAGLFLKTHLATKLKKAFWSPVVFSIEDFFCEIAGKKITENTRLLIELYDIHKKVEKGNAKSLDEFIRWGQILLTDFNEVDLYLVSTEDLFGYLSESKAISLWNTDGKPLTEYQQKYLHLYKSLTVYYKEFSIQLNAKNMSYQGMVYRQVAENIDKINLNKKWNKIIFAGFNALTASEEKIIRKLIQLEKAEILWDADKYYIENDLQEAGTIIRKNLKTIGGKEFKWLSDDFKNTEKKINIIGAVNGISQAKIVGNIIKEILPDECTDAAQSMKTAIVLLDENLLLPLLHSLPAAVSQLNITMGYPLKYAGVYSFFDNVFVMHENAKRLSKPGFSKNQGFYYKDLVKMFSHPYLLNLLSDNNENLVKIIIKRNKVFWSDEEILSLIPDNKTALKYSIKDLLCDWNAQPYISFEYMANFITVLQKQLIEEKEQKNTEKNDFPAVVEMEYLYVFSKLINNLKFSLSSISNVIELKTLHTLFSQTVGLTKLPFYGEPLKGLQIMGLLETRTLDFENLIMLSVNEGTLPSAKTNNSLIPFDIKRNFNLATYKDHDSIYAYHFYRLLQRAKNVYLLYNTEMDDFGKGERSRFINQLVYELPKYNNLVKITETIVSSFSEKSTIDYSISIKKDEEVYALLKEKTNEGISPSAINAYRSCKLRFYFGHIINLKEMEDVQEKIDAATLGNIIHYSLSELYKPYIGIVINKEQIECITREIEASVRQAFLKYFNADEINYGKNYLLYRVAIKLISKFMEKEMDVIELLKKENTFLTIVALEKAMEKQINLLINNKNIPIRLYGKCDRIDSTANTLRIIDYKTGFFEKKEVTIKDWNDLIDKSEMDKCFQLLFYAYLAKGISDKPVQSGIISLKKLKEGFVSVTSGNDNKYLSNEDFSSFENALQKIFEEMFDKNIPFSQTEVIERCTYCPYIMICNKE